MYSIETLRADAVRELLTGVYFFPQCLVGLSLAESIRENKTLGATRLIETILKRLQRWRAVSPELAKTYIEFVGKHSKEDEVYAEFILFYLGHKNCTYIFRKHFFKPEGDEDVLAAFMENLLTDMQHSVQSFVRLPLYQ